jgi:hypothetical protein
MASFGGDRLSVTFLFSSSKVIRITDTNMGVCGRKGRESDERDGGVS